MTAIVSAFAFLSAFLLVVSLNLAFHDVRRFKKERLIRAIKGQEDERETPGAERRGVEKEGLLARLLYRVDLTSIEYLIKAAHLRLPVERFFLISLVSGIFCGILPLFFSLSPLLALGGAAGGFFVPYGLLKIRQSRHEEVLTRQLPEAIESVARGLRAGQSVDTGIREVGWNFPAPLGVEFRTLCEEMTMGLPFETVLGNFVKRFPRLPEVRILSVTFLVQRETGGNLVDTLERLASTIRERLRVKRQVKASTAEGRATAIVLGIMPVAFGAVTWVMRPEYMRVFVDHPTGRKLLIAAVLMETAAVFLMRLLSRFKT